MTKRYIGIDFGTSNTVIRYMDLSDSGQTAGNKPSKPLPVEFDHSDMVKTVVLERADGTREFGNRADGLDSRGTIHRNFKMDLASEDEAKRLNAERLMGEFFRYLKKGCDSYLDPLRPGDSEYTFVSYPAKWSSHARTAVETAAKTAGFKDVRSLDEPSAALHACLQERVGIKSITRLEELQVEGLIRKGVPANIMLLDLGAGTTDIVLSRYNPGEGEPDVTTLVTWPRFMSGDTFGGREVDQCLLSFVLRYLESVGAKIPAKQEDAFLRSCKHWKDNSLSADLQKHQHSQEKPDRIDAALAFQGLEDAPEFPGLDRQGFEKQLGPYLDTLPRLVNGAIKRAIELSTATEIASANDIDLVILTGGHSQWYFVKEMLAGRMTPPGGEKIILPKIRENERRLLQLDAPEQTVAMGLAYQGNPLRFRNVMSNNIWLSLKFGLSDVVDKQQIVKQQTLLPCISAGSAKPLSYRNELSQFIPISCTLLEGETIDNAVSYHEKAWLDQGVVNTFFDKTLDFFSETLHSQREWNGTYTVTVSINENQTGTILVTVETYGNSRSVRFAI